MALKLARLQFVVAYASWAADVVSKTYSTARGYVPKFLDQYVSWAEDQGTTFLAPVYNQFEDISGKALQTADRLVDTALTAANNALGYARDLHNKNMRSFNTAKDTYFKYLDNTVVKVKDLINPYPYIQYGVDTAKWVFDKVVMYADPDKAVDTVAKAAAYPPVAKVLELGEPIIKPAEAQYQRGHDYLVTNPTYKKVYSNFESTLRNSTSSPLYRRARDAVWPVAEPWAGPLYDKFAHSKYLSQLADHMRPKVA